MKLGIKVFLWIILIGTITSCHKDGKNMEQMIHRQSADRSQEILYISNKVAVFRMGDVYSLVLASWLNKPSLSAFTGDQVDQYLVADLRKIAYLKDQNILLGFGSMPNRSNVEDASKSDDKFWVYNFENIQFFDSEADMTDSVKKKFNADNYELMGISEFMKKYSE